MKEMLKNPNVYYILIPVLVGFWALMACFVFYPGSVSAYQEDAKPEYEKTQEWIEKLVAIAPQRLQNQNKLGSDGKFDFGNTINTLAQLFEIPSSSYTLNIRPEVPRAGKRARTASMSIKEIDIEKTARFVSTMLGGWPDLKCDTLSFDKAKTGKDNWKVEMSLTYYYSKEK